MKRLAILLVVALSLGGCANLQTAFQIATTPVTVTPAMAQDVQEAAKVATSGLVAYRRLCIKKVIDPVTRNCRAVIVTIQPYTRAAAVAIVDLRQAVRENDQVTAIRAYIALQRIVANIQTERQKAGVN